MRVAILQCDSVLDKFQPQFGDYPEMISGMFADSNASLLFDTFDCRLDKFPDDIDIYDFYITTGSKSSVYDDSDWIRQVITFIKKLNHHKKKFIGICFGHQLIAMACNGKVEKSNKGWGIGVAENHIFKKPSGVKETPVTINILASHQDQIIKLPEDTTVIAGNAFCPNFIVQWGNNFLSIQGHPEWNREYSRALINDRRALIPAGRIQSGLDSLQTKPDNTLFARWILDFVQHAQR